MYVYISIYILSCYYAILLYKLLFLICILTKIRYYLATIMHYHAPKQRKNSSKNKQQKQKKAITGL